MKLSTKGRYGVRAMLDLALQGQDVQVSLKSIAKRQEISDNYLEQIFSVMKKNSLVKSIRGSQGGYVLGRSPENITVGDILRVLEGPISLVDCVDENNRPVCNRQESCVISKVWQKVADKINEVVDSVTLQHLMDEYEKNNKRDNLIYYI